MTKAKSQKMFIVAGVAILVYFFIKDQNGKQLSPYKQIATKEQQSKKLVVTS